MRRTDRLFELIQLFRGGRLLRACDIAEQLEVSLRTVYRDIDTLTASGVPIEGARGLGYVLREPIFLPPMTLTTQELEALHLGIEMVKRLGDETLTEAAGRLRAKVDAVLPGDRRGVDHAAGTAVLSARPEGVHRFLPALRAAIRERRYTTIDYHRLDGATTRRRIRPLHLEYWGQAWTCTAWCQLRDGFRVFRVDRIEACQASTETFAEEPGKTFADYIAGCDLEGGCP